MADELIFVEAETAPVCPFCEAVLQQIEYRRQKLTFGTLRGFSWIILLTCPHCRKILGTQTWD